MTGSESSTVDELAVGDGEDPGAEAGFVAGEVAQMVEDPQEHLAGQVLGLAGAVRPQVAGDAPGE